MAAGLWAIRRPPDAPAVHTAGLELLASEPDAGGLLGIRRWSLCGAIEAEDEVGFYEKGTGEGRPKAFGIQRVIPKLRCTGAEPRAASPPRSHCIGSRSGIFIGAPLPQLAARTAAAPPPSDSGAVAVPCRNLAGRSGGGSPLLDHFVDEPLCSRRKCQLVCQAALQ